MAKGLTLIRTDRTESQQPARPVIGQSEPPGRLGYQRTRASTFLPLAPSSPVLYTPPPSDGRIRASVGALLEAKRVRGRLRPGP